MLEPSVCTLVLFIFVVVKCNKLLNEALLLVTGEVAAKRVREEEYEEVNQKKGL